MTPENYNRLLSNGLRLSTTKLETTVPYDDDALQPKTKKYINQKQMAL
jgi:hypothetical protein